MTDSSGSSTNWLRLAIGTGAAIVLSYVFLQNKKKIYSALGIDSDDEQEEFATEGRKRKAQGLLMRQDYQAKMNRSVEEFSDTK